MVSVNIFVSFSKQNKNVHKHHTRQSHYRVQCKKTTFSVSHTGPKHGTYLVVWPKSVRKAVKKYNLSKL